MKARTISVIAMVLAAAAVSGCGGTTATNASSTTAPLGRPIGPATPAVTSTAARAAARGFLRGYLAALYGHASVDQITDTTALLRRLLRRQAPRVPPAQRLRHPRVTHLVLEPATPRRMRGQATVDDGDLAPYPLPFVIARDDNGRWRVTSVGD